MNLKKCSHCEKKLCVIEFSKNRTTKDGFSSWCKHCTAIMHKEYRTAGSYKISHSKSCQRYNKSHRDKRNKLSREYSKTVIGCLRRRFHIIKQRCNNPKCKAYKWYGGRGIKCLFESSDEFVNYVINELQVDPCGLEIDRINNDGNYEPGNVRLITHKENMNNRSKI